MKLSEIKDYTLKPGLGWYVSFARDEKLSMTRPEDVRWVVQNAPAAQISGWAHRYYIAGSVYLMDRGGANAYAQADILAHFSTWREAQDAAIALAAELNR